MANSSLSIDVDASPAYNDLGDCSERCPHCNAAFWYGERLKGHEYGSGAPAYHLCCSNGRVLMRPEQDPPEYIQHLLQQNVFMENIRAYNQMFAMTSFGITVDETVNHGRGHMFLKSLAKYIIKLAHLFQLVMLILSSYSSISMTQTMKSVIG